MSEKLFNPNFSKSQAAEITKRLFGLTPSEMDPLPSYSDQNFYLATVDGGKYVLKIFNFKDSENPKRIGVQVQSMSFLHQNGLPVPTAVPTTSGQLMSLEEAGRVEPKDTYYCLLYYSCTFTVSLVLFFPLTDFGCGLQKYLVILLIFLPGTTISKVPSTPQLLYEVGRTAARMDKTLQNV